MALANLGRKKGRTVFLLLIVVFSVGTLVSMLAVTRAMREEIGQAFDQIGANIVILPGAARRWSYSGVALPSASAEGQYLAGSSADVVRTIKNKDSIAIVAPKLLAVVDAPGGPALAVGVRWPAESHLRKWWKVRVTAGGLPVAYADPKGNLVAGNTEVVLGSRMAAKLGADVGNGLVLGGRQFRVAGVLESLGTDEDRAIWMDLATLQGLSGLDGRISLLEVAALCNSCPIEEIVAQLSRALPGTKVSAIKAAVTARQAVVDRFARFAQTLSVAMAVLGLGAVVLTMLGSVRERTREIGVLRALGFRTGHVLAIFYLEAAALGSAGGLLGLGAGVALAVMAGPSIAQTAFVAPWRPLELGAVASGAVLAMLGASTVAATQAARIDPVKALRLL